MATVQVFGSKCSESFASYDPESQSWKTFQLSLSGDCQEFLEAFPKSGTMRSGELYQVKISEPRPCESGGFVFPSPRASEWKQSGPIGSKSYEHMRKRRYLCAVIQEYYGTSGKLNPRFVEWLLGFPTDWIQ